MRLLEATLDVLGTHGVARATSRQIAAAAGVNLQAITYHFGSKDELVAQALVYAVRRWVEPARAALTGVEDDPLGHLLGAVSALQDGLERARDHVPAYLEALAAAPRNETVREQIVALLAELRSALATSIGQLRDAGYVASWVEPEPMAALIVAAGDGYVLHSTLDPESYAPGRTLPQVVQLLLAARSAAERPGDEAVAGEAAAGPARRPAERVRITRPTRVAGSERPTSQNAPADPGNSGPDDRVTGRPLGLPDGSVEEQ